VSAASQPLFQTTYKRRLCAAFSKHPDKAGGQCSAVAHPTKLRVAPALRDATQQSRSEAERHRLGSKTLFDNHQTKSKAKYHA
jgi:hypothetical protein